MSPSKQRERFDVPVAIPHGSEEGAISKSMVNRAGRNLADRWAGTLDLRTLDDLEAAMVVDLWRQAHSEPLAWVTQQVAERLGVATGQAVVAQRLKRMPQIIKKLARLDKMALARMQDIGGCRAVVGSVDDVRTVEDRIHKPRKPSWPLRYRHDYREEGKPDTGYRALHLVVVRNGYLIEIQLRTMRQHAWAEAVERTTALSDHNVKDGEAPGEILEYFRLTSEPSGCSIAGRRSASGTGLGAGNCTRR
jgi:hypothetical protein